MGKTVAAGSLVAISMNAGQMLFLECSARMAVIMAVAAAGIAVRSYRIRRKTQRREEQERIRSEMLAKQRDQAISRAQVAGELHDSVGHDLTTIIAQAQGFADSVEVKELQEVLKDINQAARDGLADTRQAVRTLVREHEALPQESNDDGHGDEHGQALGDRKPAIHVHQGVGLKQIGEQCRLMGGGLSSGPRKNGGWTVEAILPGTGKKGGNAHD